MFQTLECGMPDLRVTKPSGLAPSLFFHVYSGTNAIGYAQLSSRAENNHRRSISRRTINDESAPGISYCLKIIEVSQNYRNKGVGSALLDEVIGFCKDEQIVSIFGEAKGDSAELRRWYQGKGFDLDSVDNIQLSF
ncbi:MAG: GNAT family N-acetyltransferase [Gammaproteobacteria bacterium]|nr:GNAT family N-acetyltransferase [Gammaproteobacteria bacterium]